MTENQKIGSLLYRGSRDGYAAKDFHRKCNNQGKTLTIVLSQNGNVFGAFSDIEWKSINKYVKDGQKKSFLFAIKEDKSVIKLSMREDKDIEIAD